MKTCPAILEACISNYEASRTWPQALAALTAALSSLSTLSLVSWTSPSIPILISNASHIGPITLEEASYFTVIPPVAAIVFSPALTMIVDTHGRRITIMLLAVIYFTSWMMIAFSGNLITLYISRLVTGIGDAALFTAVPVYVGEITEPSVRGFWANFIGLFGFVGQFLVNLTGTYFSIKSTALILSSVPLLQFWIMSILPESPYFLLMKNKEEEAKTSLRLLRWKRNVDDEFNILYKDVKSQTFQSGSLKDLLTVPANRKTLFVAIGVRSAQQLSGLPAFAMYTQYIFFQTGSDISASTSAIIFSGAFLIVTSVSIFIINRFERKLLMTFSCSGCAIILLLEGLYFFVHEKTDVDTSCMHWFPLAGMLVYILTCASGLATIRTLMLGELFSASVKGKAMAILNICFSIVVVAEGKFFQVLTEGFGMFVPFCFFSFCCFCSVAFAYYFVPETKDKTLEEIQQALRGQTTKRDSEN